MKNDTISRNISLLMEHFNIKNESQLAKQVGMAQTTINKLTAGTSTDPRISTLMPIAQHFNIHIDTLFSENPSFTNDSSIPIITYDELNETYEDLDSLTTTNWPYWYPVPKKGGHYYAVQVFQGQILEPFHNSCLLIVENKQNWQDNTYCLAKHIASDSINIKKVYLENGDVWLTSLKPNLPPIKFDSYEWQHLGTIQAKLIDLAQGKFIQEQINDEQ